MKNHPDSLRTYLDRYRQDLLARRELPTDPAALVAAQAPDGSWSDLPPVDAPESNGPNFTAIAHLRRVRDLALAWAHPGSAGHGSADALAAVARGLEFWRDHEPTSANWWWNDIGVPFELDLTLPLIAEALPAPIFRWAAHRLTTGYRLGLYRTVGDRPATGTNLVWLAQYHLLSACLLGDPEAAAMAATAIKGELRIQLYGDEGLQHDLCLHQHGSMLYNGGYGAPLAIDLCRIAPLLHDTDLAFSAEQLEILAQFILVGHGWSTWAVGTDLGCVGRNNTRIPSPQGCQWLATACDRLAPLLPHHAGALARLAAGVRRTGPAHGGQLGHRHFYRSDWMIARRETFHFSVRMVSNRLLGSEAGANEGRFNLHLGDGMTHLLLDGDDYRFLAPLWNWRQIPGTTLIQLPTPPVGIPWGKGANGFTPWAAGVSDGADGLAAFRALRDGLDAWKAWFCVGDVVLCLGAGITAPGPHPVVTTLDQRRSHAPAVIGHADGSTGTLTEGPLDLPSPAWIWHDGFAYVSLDAAPWQVTREHRTGNWRDLCDSHPDHPEAATVFTILRPHGVAPRDESYAYALRPAAGPGAHLLADLPRIVANTAALQAVHIPATGRWMIAFHAPGRLELEPGTWFESPRQSVVLLDRDASGAWRGWAANPEPWITELTFTLETPAAAPRHARVPINVPAEVSGRSVAFTLA